MPWEEVQKREGGRERRNGGRAVLDNAILVAMKRGLYVFFRDLKASSGHWGPGRGECMWLQNAGGRRSESLYCLPWSWHRECEVLCPRVLAKAYPMGMKNSSVLHTIYYSAVRSKMLFYPRRLLLRKNNDTHWNCLLHLFIFECGIAIFHNPNTYQVPTKTPWEAMNKTDTVPASMEHRISNNASSRINAMKRDVQSTVEHKTGAPHQGREVGVRTTSH